MQDGGVKVQCMIAIQTKIDMQCCNFVLLKLLKFALKMWIL